MLVVAAAAGDLAEAASADPPPDGDLAYARGLATVELLGIDFSTRAIDSRQVASGRWMRSRSRRSFPAALTIDQASAALDPFTS